MIMTKFEMKTPIGFDMVKVKEDFSSASGYFGCEVFTEYQRRTNENLEIFSLKLI